MSCKSCYQLLLSLNPAQPHCVVKFRSNYGDIDWDSTWKTLFFVPFKRKDLCWEVTLGVLYTAHRLVSFGLNVPPYCLCGHCDETLEHLFFHCPLDQSGLDWIQSLLFLSSPAITVRQVLFDFSSDELLSQVKSSQVNLYLNTVKSIRNLKIKNNLTILNKIQNLTTTNLTKTCFS